MAQKMKPGSCSKCGGPLDEFFRCVSAMCEGRYRHPVNADGDPCKCNVGHLVRNSQGAA